MPLNLVPTTAPAYIVAAAPAAAPTNLSPAVAIARAAVPIGAATSLALQQATVTVSACGRNLQVDAQTAGSLAALMGVLQKELAMQGQAFEVFDVHGANLPTDEDLRQAVSSQRTPLVATLTEGTIHYIENRREELSQMQWKVVRDQLNGLSEKIMQLGRHMHELNEAQTLHRKEVDSTHERLRHELHDSVENAKEIGKQTFMQAIERVDALSHFIHSERNVREASIQGIERQSQGVREAIDQDKSSRRSEAQASASLLEQYHQEFLEEVRTRQALEDRHKFDVHRLNERIDVLPRLQAEPVHELSEEIKKVTLKFQASYEDHTRQLLHVKTSTENTHFEANMRFQKIEEKVLTAEERLASVAGRQEPKFDEIWSRIETLSASQEEERTRAMIILAGMKGGLGPVQELEDALARPGADGKSTGVSISSAGADATSDAFSTARSNAFSTARSKQQRSISAEPPTFRQNMVARAVAPASAIVPVRAQSTSVHLTPRAPNAAVITAAQVPARESAQPVVAAALFQNVAPPRGHFEEPSIVAGVGRSQLSPPRLSPNLTSIGPSPAMGFPVWPPQGAMLR